MLNKNVVLQFLTFAFVGGLATLTHYLAAIVVVEYFAQLVYVGNIAGYLCAVCVSFFGHSLLTFKQPLARHTLVRFIVGSITTVILSQLVLFILDSILNMNPRVSMAIAVFYILIQSYTINKFWVYKSPTTLD